MRKDLRENWDIEATTLYDRPVKSRKQKIDKNDFLLKYGQRKIEEN